MQGITLNRAIVLVIDDYHLLQDENVHEFIVLLARKELPHLHLVLTTRAVALDALDELKLQGDCPAYYPRSIRIDAGGNYPLLQDLRYFLEKRRS